MIKVSGIMKLNPEYKKWKNNQEGVHPSAPTKTEVAAVAATDASGIPIVSATYVDENFQQAPPPTTMGAASGYNAPNDMVHVQPHQHEPISSVPAPNQPQGQYQQQGHSSPANLTPAQQVPVYARFGSQPVEISCPSCHRQMRTRTSEVIGVGAIVAVIILLFLFWPLFWLPLVISDCKEVHHYCTLCRAKVGEKPCACCNKDSR